VAEFNRKDLGKDMRKNMSALRMIAPRTKPTSILLSTVLINKLRSKAGKRGIGYQTMLKIILNEHVDQY
jgi:predicted DNA binding CopG/RHH family protein